MSLCFRDTRPSVRHGFLEKMGCGSASAEGVDFAFCITAICVRLYPVSRADFTININPHPLNICQHPGKIHKIRQSVDLFSLGLVKERFSEGEWLRRGNAEKPQLKLGTFYTVAKNVYFPSLFCENEDDRVLRAICIIFFSGSAASFLGRLSVHPCPQCSVCLQRKQIHRLVYLQHRVYRDLGRLAKVSIDNC